MKNLTELPEGWEDNEFTDIRNLHYRATKLKAAILSQEQYLIRESGLEKDFISWYERFNENLSELLDGGLVDINFGNQAAAEKLLDLINEMPIHWIRYQIFGSHLIHLINSDN